ncbi:hypothetical protein [Dissulfurispira sp.]|uniref:hypothetical protein n=1 Tax=Dissulfurispira sp. TaxID=2817609 RepID=UPI002FDB0E00
MMIPKSESSRSLSAEVPSQALLTVKPCRLSASKNILLTKSLSSTTSTFLFPIIKVSFPCSTREGISLKGRVVRTDGNKDDGRRYGLGIQLTEQPSDYSFLIDSFLT